MTEINSSLPSEIDDFFDNIPENEEDLTSLFTEVAINKARELLVSDLDSVDNNSESTGWDTSSALTIASGSTEAEDEIEIPQTSSSNLTPCALIDIINGSIQRCGEVKNLRGLAQLVGTWQLDDNAVCEAKLENLGVCREHFMFDQNRLHKEGAKKEQDVTHSYLHRRRCLFCGHNFYYFSRGKFCYEHSVSFGSKNLHIPCIGQKSCPALEINELTITTAKLQQKS